jgi:hypothetical protein
MRKQLPDPVHVTVQRWLAPLILVAAVTLPATASVAGPSRAPPAHREYADDPGIQRSIEGVLEEARTGSFEPAPTGPHGSRFRAFYKGYGFICTLKNASACWYSGLGIMFYPTAWLDLTGFWRVLRLGIGMAGAGESKQDRTRWWQHNFGLEVALALGLQYPARFTPYGEFVLGLGALHRNIYNKDFIEFAFSVGLEVGFEVYLTGHFNLGVALGWRRSMVNTGAGVFYANSFTFSVGIGL